jgi:hypothetical protein
MKTERTLPATWILCSLTLGLSTITAPAPAKAETNLPESPRAKTAEAIPWSQVGARAGADYQGDGLSVTPTESGAHLRCVFQHLNGEATGEGLWLTSTVNKTNGDRFRVKAATVGRQSACLLTLPARGTATSGNKLVVFARTGLLEEYSVSMDGVRQDFVVTQRPAGPGELQVGLEVAGARVEPAADGAQLVLEHSGRKLAYSRLRVTDARGRELPARTEVSQAGNQATKPQPGGRNPDVLEGGSFPTPSLGCVVTEHGAAGTRHALMLAIVVDDAGAEYPVRIDPTFSDANWISLNPSIPGANSTVYAAVADSSGNLYIGGSFTFVGDAKVNYIAKWNGTIWSALGSGMNGTVNALAVSGSDLYAGGSFTTAGGYPANRVAKWNGSTWSWLGAGTDKDVLALAVSGSDLYAGGIFTWVDGLSVHYIAKWNGSSWSALGSGMFGTGTLPGVFALARLSQLEGVEAGNS